MQMVNYIKDRLRDEDGADTVEVIIGIVVFVVFGLAVFGMITKAAGNKVADVSNCLKDSGTIISSSSDKGATCSNSNSDNHTYSYGSN
jgi:hypothetical protein